MSGKAKMSLLRSPGLRDWAKQWNLPLLPYREMPQDASRKMAGNQRIHDAEGCRGVYLSVSSRTNQSHRKRRGGSA